MALVSNSVVISMERRRRSANVGPSRLTNDLRVGKLFT